MFKNYTLSYHDFGVDSMLCSYSDAPKMVHYISDNTIKGDWRKMWEINEFTLKSLINNSQPKGFLTAFRDLDYLLNGFEKGELYFLAGRTAMGKTTLAVNIARNLAVDSKKKVFYVSAGMSFYRLALKFLLLESGYNEWELREAEEDEMLDEAIKRIAETPILVDDTWNITIEQIEKQIANTRPDIVIIDYLQLIDVEEKLITRQAEMSSIAKSLKGMARKYDIPILLLSKVGPEVDDREDKHPDIFDLRRYGAIAQDMDVIMFLYREDYYDELDTMHATEIRIAKARQCKCVTSCLGFIKEREKYVNF